MQAGEAKDDTPPEQAPRSLVPARKDSYVVITPAPTTIVIPAEAAPRPAAASPPRRPPEPPEHCEHEEEIHPPACPPKERPLSLKEFRRKHGGFGLGEAIGIVTALIAGVAASSVLLTVGVPAAGVLAIDAGLALLGTEGLMRQHRKQVLNQYHAYRSYDKREGYHREPEYLPDQSLVHEIQGASDLPQRAQYIEKTYGVKVTSREEFRNRHVATGLLLGALAAVAVGAVVSMIAPFAPLAMGVVVGSLVGGTAMATHSAKVMEKYGNYLDGVAQKEEAKAAKEDRCRDVEYDNGKDRGRSHAADIAASRQEQRAAACR